MDTLPCEVNQAKAAHRVEGGASLFSWNFSSKNILGGNFFFFELRKTFAICKACTHEE